MDMLINNILTLYKNHLDIDKNQEAVLKYSLQVTMSSILGYALSFAVALPLGIFTYVFVIMVTGSILRFFSGGAHCSSMGNCVTYTMLISNILGLLAKIVHPTNGVVCAVSIIVFLFSVWSIKKYAPADTPQKPITSEMKREKLKRRALIFVFLWFSCIIGYYMIFKKIHIMILASALGIFWQCLSITKFGYKLWHMSDGLFNKILGKERGYR